jgi:hypothetical protein
MLRDIRDQIETSGPFVMPMQTRSAMLATGNIVIQDDDADAPKAQKKLAQGEGFAEPWVPATKSA